MSQRQQSNLELAAILEELIKKHPDLRFGQILAAFGFIQEDRKDHNSAPLWVNEFYTEPEEVLVRVAAALKKNSKT